MDDIYKDIEAHNPNKKRKVLITFDNMIADILSNQIFMRGRKLNNPLVFTTQSYFSVPKI